MANLIRGRQKFFEFRDTTSNYRKLKQDVLQGAVLMYTRTSIQEPRNSINIQHVSDKAKAMVKLDTSSIPTVNKPKILGGVFNNLMNFSTHDNQICSCSRTKITFSTRSPGYMRKRERVNDHNIENHRQNDYQLCSINLVSTTVANILVKVTDVPKRCASNGNGNGNEWS